MAQVKMNDPRTARLGDLRSGQHADGSPLHDIRCLKCKPNPEADESGSPASKATGAAGSADA